MEAYNIQYGHVSDVIRLEKNLSFKGNKHFLKPTEGLAVKYLFAEIWEHDQTGCREPIILYTSRTECKHKWKWNNVQSYKNKTQYFMKPEMINL